VLPPAPSSDDGVPGGVVGGIAGGVLGGVVGGLPAAPPPPPPPPAPPKPVRVGGQIQAPSLIRRVDPEYPTLARAAKVQGVVILEATVGTSGQVQRVQVLRSIPLLDQAAVKAVKQWRYSPLTLNGKPTPFVLTVTVDFTLK
jgi:protein TonB